MKKIYVLWSLAIAALMANVFSACSNDETLDDIYTPNGFTMQLAKTPDFVLYSNGNVLASTFMTTRAETRGETDIIEPVKDVDFLVLEDYMWYPKNQDPIYTQYAANAPARNNSNTKIPIESVTDAEYDFVMAYIQEHKDEGKKECSIKKDYFLQNVGSSNKPYTFQIPADNPAGYREETFIGGNVMNYLYFDNIHIAGNEIAGDENNYSYTSHQGHRLLCFYDKIPLTNPSYKAMYGDLENMNYNAYTFYYIKYGGKMFCYLCFDYRMSKTDDNGKPFVYNGDGFYDDWVIKVTAADGSEIKVPGDDPVITDEVEVNLSVNDEKEEDDYIATKLSIHVRANTDVEVFIPVEPAYYCDVDDMAIVLSHKKDLNYQYSNLGESSLEDVNGYTYTYTIAGQTLTVIVTYKADGIRVKTAGMTQAVLDYLQKEYEDGITFEVWNYFNSEKPNPENTDETLPVTRAELKTEFDKSTVTFTSTEPPSYYVNAFAMLYDYKKDDIHVYMKDGKPYLGDNEDANTLLEEEKYWIADADGNFVKFVGSKNEWDCTVTPPAAYAVEATHNGQNPADFNVVYKKK